MTKPISPSQVKRAKTATIPPALFEAFNELIAKEWDGNSATVRQEDAIKLVRRKLKAAGKTVTTDRIFENGWMDVEDAYRAEGWTVEYDKPAYCETYEPTFTFTKPR